MDKTTDMGEMLAQAAELLDQLSDSEYKTQFASVQTLLQENIALIKRVGDRMQSVEQSKQKGASAPLELDENAALLVKLNANIEKVVDIYRKVSAADAK